MNIEIRQAVLEDLDIITQLNIRLLEEENEFDINPYLIKSGFEQLINNKNACIFLVICNNSIIGICTLHFMISTVEGGMIAQLEDVYIDQAYRRIGLGTKLLKYLEGYCKNKNIKRIQLLCKIDNIPAIKLYKKSLFKPLKRYYFYKKLSI